MSQHKETKVPKLMKIMAISMQDRVRVKGHPVYLAYVCCVATFVVLIYLTYGSLFISTPLFHLNRFYVSALNKSINSTTAGAVISFDLEIQNQMVNLGVRYNGVNLTFTYGTVVLGTYTAPGFYQGMNKTAHRQGVVSVDGGRQWKEAAMRDISDGSTAAFGVDLAADVRFKNWFWYVKEKRIRGGGRVEVDDSGEKVGREGVELSSGEAPPSVVTVVLYIVGYIILVIAAYAVACFGVLFVMSYFYGRTRSEYVS